MANIMQQRRDTAINWTTVNPILAHGQIAYEIDGEPWKQKVGDGLTRWNDLPYDTGESISSFTSLTDTPDSYTNQAGNFVTVNEKSDGLVFTKGLAQKTDNKFYPEDGAVINKMKDRLQIGGATTASSLNSGADKSWVGYSAHGLLTYFDTRSQQTTYSTIGSVAGAFASRSSDGEGGQQDPIVVASYCQNDNSNKARKTSGWCFYGHARHDNDNEFTCCMEVDIANTSTKVVNGSYNIGQQGVTVGHWIGVGGETAQSGIEVNPASCAIGIITSAPHTPLTGKGALWNKGIVFQADALCGANGTDGSAVAIEMGKGHELVWVNGVSATSIGGVIRSDNNNAPAQTRVIFDNTGLAIKGVKSDLTTEVTLLQVPALPDAINWLTINAGTSGNAVTLRSSGYDSNIDLCLAPKGTGLIQTGYSVSNATTPSSFQAQQILKFKDASGTVYYIPCRAGTW